ncbi:AMP-binding enzyme family protein 26 [Achromobacter xylosoxidans A8]|uniref:AMP-binding enzyme family protein 26 n=1 Tax=Achromobacter xylosoxidans (strain A8) TaxID=762376 RepID=E3HHA2_ACHXA|nr:AMP-binding protein [Achromobacter xylosoxidans]ADP19052.1 AMP-binding enzyme family protein 26 [Achromobacter xylosoxidans A8]
MDAAGNRTITDLLDEQALCHGHRLAIVHEYQNGDISQLSYIQLREAARGFAAGLQARGVMPGDRVFVFMGNTAEYVPLWMGLMLAGAVIVAGNIYLTAPEVAYQLEHCQPALALVEPTHEALIREVCAGMAQPPDIVAVARGSLGPEGLSGALAGAPADYQAPDQGSDDLAQILYTSGTSARPKGVMLTQANLLWCGQAGAANSGLSRSDRVFNNKPLFHANCQETVLSCLTAGATAVIGERYSATRYLRQLIEHRITICSLSGMLCRTLLNQPPTPFDQAHQVRYAGYAINISEAEIAAFIERFRIPLRNGYGQSETMLYITLQPHASPSSYPSIGRATPDREVFVVDDDNQPVAAGAVGEIVVRGRPGRTLTLGYYRDPAATQAVFEGGWLHTGDLGYQDAKGNFFFFGRKKEVIKRAGENISAAEVEEALMGHPAVRDVAVVGIPDPVRDQSVKAFIVLHAGHQADADAIKAFCAQRLAYFKVPEQVQFMAELPRNASGKVQKRALLDA